MTEASISKVADPARAMILPLAMAQFIASYSATNMDVAISAIASDLGTTVAGVQTAITLFTLTMAALMIPGSKLTDIWGRKRCFVLGLAVYAVGGLLAAVSQGLPLLIGGYSLLEGVGSALMIPPIYILVTVTFPDVKSRARYFGVVSGAGGLGAAAGPLIGGLVTSAISWRASFGLQVLVVAWIILLARKITDPARTGPAPRFDLAGAVLSAAGLFFVVLGLLQSRTYGFLVSRQAFKIGNTVIIPKGSISPVWIFVAIGALFLLRFFLHTRSFERKGRNVPLPLRLFRNKVSNLGLGTLGAGSGHPSQGEALRCRPHHHAGDRPHWPGSRRPHPAPANPGQRVSRFRRGHAATAIGILTDAAAVIAIGHVRSGQADGKDYCCSREATVGGTRWAGSCGVYRA